MFSFPPPPNLLYFFFCFQHLFVLGGPVRLLVAPFSFLRLFFFFFFSFPVGPRNEWMGTARAKKKGKKERRKRFLRSGLPPVRWMARKSSREAGQVGLFSLFFVVQFLSSSLFLSFFSFFYVWSPRNREIADSYRVFHVSDQKVITWKEYLVIFFLDAFILEWPLIYGSDLGSPWMTNKWFVKASLSRLFNSS